MPETREMNAPESFLPHLMRHMQEQVKFIEQTLSTLPSVVYVNPELLLLLSREPGFFSHPAFRTEVRASSPVVSRIQLRRDLTVQIIEDTNELFYHFEAD